MKHAFDSTKRFSDRVEDYLRYRPRYPVQILKTLEDECGLQPMSIVADIGSGTGFLCEPFLKKRIKVFGVEPNPDMRAAAESTLRNFDTFVSIDGKAEKTNLPDASVDLITAGQAFHWFDGLLARREFLRILKKRGHVALVWNERKKDASQFQSGYEHLLREYCPDYMATCHTNIDSVLLAVFFGHGDIKSCSFDNSQRFDSPGLEGRLLSSSYAPKQGQPRHNELLTALRKLFTAHQNAGFVILDYETRMYYAPLVG